MPKEKYDLKSRGTALGSEWPGFEPHLGHTLSNLSLHPWQISGTEIRDNLQPALGWGLPFYR